MIKNSRTWCALCALIKRVENSKLSLKGHTNQRVAVQAGCRQQRRSLSQRCRRVAGVGCGSGHADPPGLRSSGPGVWVALYGKCVSVAEAPRPHPVERSAAAVTAGWLTSVREERGAVATGGKGCRPLQFQDWPSPFSTCHP